MASDVQSLTSTFKINGITESFGLANAGLLVGLGVVTDFTFTAIAGQPEFYVSGLSFLQGSSIIPTTPLPGALPLFATGLSALGLLGWRRKRKTQPQPPDQIT